MLRERLRLITESQDVDTHSGMLEELSNEIPNTIQIVESEYPIDRYTCLMYVFDFTEEPRYVDIASFGLGRAFAGTDFINYLLDENHLEAISEEDVTVGNLVAYYNGDEFKHIGKIRAENRVISKWGIGNLYEHSIFEVPIQFGNTIHYYNNLEKERALDYFVEFAKLYGIELDE